MPSGPYLPTSAAYLKESSLLLQAYPDSTRITTKYTFPKPSPTSKPPTQSPSQSQSQPTEDPKTPAAPIATLVLKTYNPEAGICLKYRTNKAAEVGRLITALGLLAGGADMGSLDKTVNAPAPGAGGDVEMGGTGAGTPTGEDVPAVAAAAAAGTGGAGGKGGKSKKKGKGKK